MQRHCSDNVAFPSAGCSWKPSECKGGTKVVENQCQNRAPKLSLAFFDWWQSCKTKIKKEFQYWLGGLVQLNISLAVSVLRLKNRFCRKSTETLQHHSIRSLLFALYLLLQALFDICGTEDSFPMFSAFPLVSLCYSYLCLLSCLCNVIWWSLTTWRCFLKPSLPALQGPFFGALEQLFLPTLQWRAPKNEDLSEQTNDKKPWNRSQTESNCETFVVQAVSVEQ